MCISFCRHDLLPKCIPLPLGCTSLLQLCVYIYIYIRMYIQQLFTHAHTHKWFVQTIELIPIPIPQRKTQHILPSVCSSMFFQATRCHTEISSNQRLYHVHVPAPNRKSSTDQSASPPWQGHKRNPTGRTCSSK